MKWIKRLVLAAVLVVAFFFIAMLGIIVLVDPDDYRDEIIALVKQQTGRDLVIEGGLGLSVFPWLGLELDRIQLHNPEGFSELVFASVERVNIKVALLPLLRLETRVGTLQFDGLSLNLERRMDGKTNWEDLSSAAETTTAATTDEAEAETAQTLPPLYVGSLDIRNTHISWRDAIGKTHVRVEDLRFTTEQIRLPEPIAFILEFGVRNESPKLLAGARIRGFARVDPAAEQYALENLHMSLQAAGTMVPGANQTLQMQMQCLAVDVKEQTVQLQQLKTQLSALTAVLDMQVASYAETPAVSGQLTANVLQLRSLMHSLGTEPPDTADPAVLATLKAQLEFRATDDTADIQNLNIAFDDSRITGSMSIKNFAAPEYQIGLNIDRINADRYLPPPVTAPASSPATPAAADAEIVLPMEQLRGLKAQGKLTLGELQLLNLKFANFEGTLDAANGKINLQPLQLDLYSGHFKGGLTIDVTGSVPQYSIVSALSGVQIEPLLVDYMKSEFISGQMNADINIHTGGERISAFKQNLNGKAVFNFRDGALSFSLREQMRKAKADMKSEPYNPPPKQPTTFSAVRASADIKQGVVGNSDLEVRAGHMYITGQGEYALPTDMIDYTVTLLMSEDPTGQDDPLKEFHDLPIKMQLRGKLGELNYTAIALSGLRGSVSAKAKQVVEEKKDELKQELKQEVEQKKEEKADKLKDKLKEKLKLKLN